MSATFCPPSMILPIYYPGRGMSICSDCKEQIIYFEDMGNWSHVPR